MIEPRPIRPRHQCFDQWSRTMARAIITLKKEAVCADCGADLEVGTVAKYYGPSNIYGLECHDTPAKIQKHRDQTGFDPSNPFANRGRKKAKKSQKKQQTATAAAPSIKKPRGGSKYRAIIDAAEENGADPEVLLAMIAAMKK